MSSLALQVLAPVAATPTYASSVTSASFGGAGTYTDPTSHTVFARSGQPITLTVNTSPTDTQCVDVSGSFTGHQTSDTAKATWTFAFTTPAGSGVQTVTATASSGFNNNGCNGKSGTNTASYTLDNSGPTVTGSLSPAPNDAGWNNSNVTITWRASDGSGSGVASGPTPATDSQTANTAGVTKTASATDQLGNSGSGSVVVKLDKVAPTIQGSVSARPNAAGWNNTDVTVSFVCSDPPPPDPNGKASGVKSCAASKTLTEGANQAVSGTAVDNADNTASTTVGNINIDKTAPTLSGAPTAAPNADGWYKGDVTIHWTASDALSGIDPTTQPADSTIAGEGRGLTATASVKDKAGNRTSATSAAINIDRTPPTTTVAAPTGWNNNSVSLSLNPSDSLSGVKATSYTLDGGAQQTGTSVNISAEGIHTLQYWSEDKAGNLEAAKSLQVKIDRTPPTITHTAAPAANANGWNNADVTVTFSCGDSLSGVASCGPNQTVTTEGQDQEANGKAVDNAGNTATDPVRVSIDKTAPTISAAADRAANANGWYNADVTVSFTCADSLSGIATCPAPQTLAEGANQSVGGTATDAAGNTARANLGGINVDKTAPTLSGAATAQPNTAGWYTGDVTVAWTCGDALSGLDGLCPANSTMTGEGDNLSASASVSDKAGNTTSQTVNGITIDRTAPSTSASVSAPLDSGWYAGPVQVTLTGTDSLSGIAGTYYSVDGGAPQTSAGPFSHSQKGSHTITFWSVDNAGNTEDRTADGHTLTLNIDDIAPSTGANMSPATPNGASGWFTTAVDITLVAGDAESGVAATYYAVDGGAAQTYTGPFTLDQTGTHTLTYWSVDRAGNVEDAAAKHNSLSIAFDNLPPTITGSRTPAANGFGWNNSDVTVSFTCSDPQSGLAATDGCTAPVTVSNEGAGQSVTGQAQDAAGNTASATVDSISIDKTAPTLAGAPTTAANAAGWYRGDVSVHWTAADGLAGVDPASQPADSLITGEGKGLAASASVSDKAGNQGTGSVSVNVDRTPPVVNGAATTSPDASGWYNKAVAVRFTCTDVLSGVASCPGDVVLDKDGAGQSATGTATDVAGNTASAIVSGINIDSTPPQTDINNRCDATTGWCKGGSVTLVLSGTDDAPATAVNKTTSGVKELRANYSLDGGKTWKLLTDVGYPWKGSPLTFSFPTTATGTATVKYYAVDNAGNAELANYVSLKYDTIAPTITHTVAPNKNAAGWSNANVDVKFTAVDDDLGSGVDGKTVKCGAPDATGTPAGGTVTTTDNKTFSCDALWNTETTGQAINAQASDVATNLGKDAETIRLDKTAPSITGAATTSPNANGWYNGPVTVKFTCADAGAVRSGIQTCTGVTGAGATAVNNGMTITANGTNAVQGTAVDNADNTTTAMVSVNIDAEKPAIAVNGVAPGAIYTLGAVPAASCTATDGFSGIDANGCTVSITGGSANGVGTFTYTATATDKAGNTATVTNTYKVIYRFDGFLQPINDTAHQTGLSTSIFKAGSTVPVKFQLKKADGTVLPAGAAPQWLSPTRGGATSAPVDESVYSDPATSGTTVQWDATGQQYVYNWSTRTATAGYYYRVGVRLDDGQTYTVDIGLR